VLIKLLFDYSAHKSFVSMSPNLQYMIQINVIHFFLVYVIEIIKQKIALFLCFISHIMDKEIYMFIYAKFRSAYQVCSIQSQSAQSYIRPQAKAEFSSLILSQTIV
jgi:hypothetical protein